SVNLPAGGSVTYTANCTIAASATGSLVNTATVTSGVTDPNPANNSATDTDTLTPQADLSITKTDGLTAAVPGQPTTYTIVASNAGPSNAPGTSVTDTFPAALTGVSWTCVGAGGGTCTAGPVAGNIADSANLPVGASVTYTVNATISGAFTGVLSNTASVAAGAGVTDPVPGNNSATDMTTVASGPNLSGTKDVMGSFVEGGTIFYTVTINNSSSTAQPDNPGDEFTDTLPAELTLVGATASSGTAATAGNTVTWNGVVPGNGSVTITIEATINPGTAGQTIANQGTINFDADNNGSNETSVMTDDPGTTPGGDPTNFVVTVGGPAIPTLSQLGLGLLALLLAAGAVWQLRRRG
ncbi:MAG: DUF11 domain-containing protein, partial [Thermoanaerobaculia bacterium]|nr:DUF11 domain-containing protein [Thermoanaerobaculia bacterium]